MMKLHTLALYLVASVLAMSCGMGVLDEEDSVESEDGKLSMVLRLTDFDALTVGQGATDSRMIDPNTRAVTVLIGGNFVKKIDLGDTPERDDLEYLLPISLELTLPAGTYPSIELVFERADGSKISVARKMDGFSILANTTTTLALYSIPEYAEEISLDGDTDYEISGDTGSTQYGSLNVSTGTVVDFSFTTLQGEKPKFLIFDSLGKPMTDFYPADSIGEMIDTYRFQATTDGTVYVGLYAKDGPFTAQGTVHLVSVTVQPSNKLMITELGLDNLRTVEIGNLSSSDINLRGYKIQVRYPEDSWGPFGEEDEDNTFVIDEDIILGSNEYLSFINRNGWYNVDQEDVNVVATATPYIATRRSGDWVDIAKVGVGINIDYFWYGYSGEWIVNFNDIWNRSNREYLRSFQNGIIGDRAKVSPDGTKVLFSNRHDYWNVTYTEWRYQPEIYDTASGLLSGLLISNVSNAPYNATMPTWAGDDSILFVRDYASVVKMAAVNDATETVLVQKVLNSNSRWDLEYITDDETQSLVLDAVSLELAFPSLSPDGTKLALSVGPYRNNGTVMVIDLVNKTVSAIGGQNAGYFQGFTEWSPDGTKLAFVQASGINPNSLEPYPDSACIMVASLSEGIWSNAGSVYDGFNHGAKIILDGWADNNTLLVSTDIYGNPSAYRMVLTGSQLDGWVGDYIGAVGRTDQDYYYEPYRYSVLKVLPDMPPAYVEGKSNAVVTKKWDSSISAFRNAYLDFYPDCLIALLQPDGECIDVVNIGRSGADIPDGGDWRWELGEIRDWNHVLARRTATAGDGTVSVQDTDSALDWISSYGTLGYKNDYFKDDEDLIVDIW